VAGDDGWGVARSYFAADSISKSRTVIASHPGRANARLMTGDARPDDRLQRNPTLGFHNAGRGKRGSIV